MFLRRTGKIINPYTRSITSTGTDKHKFVEAASQPRTKIEGPFNRQILKPNHSYYHAPTSSPRSFLFLSSRSTHNCEPLQPNQSQKSQKLSYYTPETLAKSSSLTSHSPNHMVCVYCIYCAFIITLSWARACSCYCITLLPSRSQAHALQSNFRPCCIYISFTDSAPTIPIKGAATNTSHLSSFLSPNHILSPIHSSQYRNEKHPCSNSFKTLSTMPDVKAHVFTVESFERLL